jgi:hypothetical protein
MTDEPKKRDDAGLLDALASYAADDDVQAVLQRSHEERKKQLAAKGIDADAVARRGQALADGIAARMAARARSEVPPAASSEPNLAAANVVAVAQPAEAYDLEGARRKRDGEPGGERRRYAVSVAAAVVLLAACAAAAVLLDRPDNGPPRDVPKPVDAGASVDALPRSLIAVQTPHDAAPDAAREASDGGRKQDDSKGRKGP